MNLDYHQPDFYRFSEDSTWMSKKMISQIREGNCPSLKILELCAGCGVIGIEILREAQIPIEYHFLELQKDFIPFLEKNISDFIPLDREHSTHIIQRDFKELNNPEFIGQYDLVLANPPYFDPQKNRLSEDPKRNQCRFFSKEDFLEFLKVFRSCQKTEGAGYFLYRKDNWESYLNQLKEKTFRDERFMEIEAFKSVTLAKMERASFV